MLDIIVNRSLQFFFGAPAVFFIENLKMEL